MPNGNSVSLVQINNLTKPAQILIEKISDAIGGLYQPYQIRRVAKAKVDADIIEAKAQIKITQLRRRALERFVSEEEKKQDNIEKIIYEASAYLSDSSKPQEMEDDWITNFFDKCRIISDNDMQALWARVLAGEANSPGKYSKRTVNLLNSLDKSDAQLFTTLCSFAIQNPPHLLIYDTNASVYTSNGINFSSLTHLDDIGLVNFDALQGFKRLGLQQLIRLDYFNKLIFLGFPNPDNNELQVGKVIFTNAGSQLAEICGAKPIDEFYDYLIDKWSKEGLIAASPTNTQSNSQVTNGNT